MGHIHRRRLSWLSSLALLATTIIFVAHVHAEDLDLGLFRPASPGDGVLLGVQSGRLAAERSLAMAVSFGFEKSPLVAVDENEQRIADVIGTRVGAELAAVYGLGRVELGAAMPVILHQEGEADEGTGVATASGRGLGDLRIVARARIFSRGSIGLGAALAITLPTATGDLIGDSGPTVAPRLIVDARHGRLFVAVNAGARIRESRELAMGDLTVGSALTYGAGLGIDVTSALDAIVELDGEVGGMRAEEAPLELRGGLRLAAGRDWSIAAGYGRGLVYGYGAPDHRAFLTVGWRPEPPPPDRVVPRLEIAERPDSPHDPDPDRDGLLDEADACFDVAEDVDGFEDGDGCPEADNDFDGIADASDGCPVLSEDVDQHEDADGCPDPDNDFDGLLDAADKCPLEAEIINGVEDDDGCPDEGRQLVVITESKLEIKEKLYFATGKDVILPRSEPVLAQMALTLARNPWIKKVRIEGHTDDRGSATLNQELSRRRAESVRKALVDKGIEPDRLEATGYGEGQPLDTNKTVDGRATNRRTEFVILVQDPIGMRDAKGVSLEARPVQAKPEVSR